MIKTSKVTECRVFTDKETQQPTRDQYENYSFSVTMENGDSGYMKSKDNPNTYFAVGQSVEYDIEEKEKKSGDGTYFVIKRPKKDFQGGGGAKWQPKGPKEYKSEMVGMCLKYAYDAVALFNQEEKRDVKAIKPYFEAFIKMAFDKIDEIHKEV